MRAALADLPETFDKFDLLRRLDFAPRRSTLHRVLTSLTVEGTLAVETVAVGKYPTRYRKVALRS